MWGRVMVEFCREEVLCPFGWVVGAEYLKISIRLLIGPFGLSISLRVIGSGQVYVILEEASEFSGEGRSELGSTVRDESVM